MSATTTETSPTAAPSAAELQSAIETLTRAGHRAVQRLGYHFQPNHFYSPLNDCDFLEANLDLWANESNRARWGEFVPVEIDWRTEHQLEVAREVGAFAHELRDVPRESADPGTYHWKNPMWAAADPIVQYGLYRSRKPRRVVEIGCGWSSLLMARALLRNQAEGGARTEVTQIEPHPRPEIMASLPRHWAQHRAILQRAPYAIFEQLGDGDVLFYDGSHCAKVASDVNWFFFRVLPRLRRGVLIHIHDIMLPKDYHEEWVFKRGQTWNEQYLLQAFLMHNDTYQIEIANSYLCFRHADTLRALYGDLQPVYGGSLWMRKVADPSPRNQ